MQTIIVRRVGDAKKRRASIDGVQLDWQSGDPDRSKPKQLPAGEHLFSWYVECTAGQTYGFLFEDPAGIPCIVDPGGPCDGNGRNWGECEFELI